MRLDTAARDSLLRTAFRMSLGMAVVFTPGHADILRGGGGSGGSAPPAANGSPAGGAPPATTNQARVNAQDSLARTTQALNAVRAMQAAARANALNGGSNNLGSHPVTGQPLPNVPDGLGSGGLQLDPRVGTDPQWWQGAELPGQTTNGTQTNVTIRQTAQQALLNWETFNVGRNTTVHFDQTAGGSNASNWIAFNRVNDPTGNPTQILGSIKAEGQVYIINRNGIIFGGSSQVNVNSLTASALPINETLVANGLLNNPNREFLFDGLGQGRIGDVTVQAGAIINSPVSADGNGGRVMLVGANVHNAGTISTPAGQTILAAGLQVGVAAHLASDPSLRGLDTYVGAVVDPASALDPYAGTATNSGLIEAARANVTITGKSVQQLGFIESSTSVALNGRIDLLANYGAVANANYNTNGTQGTPFLFTSSGSVTLGEDSVTRILPQWADTDRAVGSELALRSQINLQGQTIHLDEGSEILAPNARVSMKAGRWVGLSSTPYSTFIADGGQVYIDRGAVVNLAGTAGASASVLQNYLTLVLRGSELAVAPLQQDGELRGDTITVDITQTGTYNGRDWVGTPLADVSGFVNLIERDVSQLTTAGGSLDISAGGSVVIRDGSTIDVSGGWTDFTGAVVRTTQVISNGQLIDIANATPDQVYSGIYTGTSNIVHSKWGVVEGFHQALAPNGQRYQQGYTQGANAGGLSISAPSIALDGNLVGNTVQGTNQVRSGSTGSNLPAAASLALRFQAQLLSAGSILTWHPEQPDVIFGNADQEDVADFATDASGAPFALAESRRETVYLSPDLFSTHGFGNLTVENAEGNILLPEDITLQRQVGGSLTLKAANIDIQGDIIAPGGTLSFSAHNISPYDAQFLNSDSPVPNPVPGQGNFTLGANATLNVAGLVTDDRQSLAAGNPSPLQLRGGSVSVAAYNADLQAGSVIDVSGGYLMTAGNSSHFGNAGSISIRAGQDPAVAPVLGGTLNLGSTLRGYSGARGGTLSLQAQHVQIGGINTDPSTLLLSPEFFNQGGFGTFNISGLGGGTAPAVLVTEGTEVAPVVQSYRVNPGGGGPLSLEIIEDVVGLRQPVSLNLSAPGVRDFSSSLFVRGDVVVGEGSILRTDPGGSVSVTGNTVSVLGSIITPGGSINVAGGSSTALVFNDITQARATTFIGSNALLSAAGTTVLLPDAYGRRVGQVLNGGNITLGGNIAASGGAVLDVSGTSGILDVNPALANPSRRANVPVGSGINRPINRLATVPVEVHSNGGSITLRGGQMLFSDATLLANAGGSTATGGSLTVSSGRFDPPGVIPPASSVNLTVQQSGAVIGGNAAIGAALGNAGHFSIDSFNQGGFDNLTLGGVVSFDGAVDVNARGSLRVATDGFLYANSQVNLTASHVALGKAFQPPSLPSEVTSPFGNASFSPTYGSGSLNVTAKVIDIGSLSLQNIGNATLSAVNGDIRGSGTFHMAGDLTLRAGQVYPLTASSLSFIAYDHGQTAGSITIEQSGRRQLPLSAGGTLGIYASHIEQRGTLRAPFGTINLGWDGTGTAPVDIIAGNSRPMPVTSQVTLGAGSVTSVSAVDPLTGKGIVIPYGISTDGENWIDPHGVDVTTGGVPEKSIVIAGQSVTTEDGSTVDLRGGGDLYAYRWVPALGGPSDILASTTSFAIIPGYQADFAPVSQFNPSDSASNLIGGAGDGYTNSSLQVGDRIYVAGSKTLAEGYYTLLPARYALLPGAVLVSAAGGDSGLGTVEMPDRSSVVSGFRFNGLNSERTLPTLATRFELASSSVVRKRAEYQDFLANVFLKKAAESANTTVPRLPTDSGHLVFQATQAMELLGEVASNSISGGRGSSIDISTPLDTFIASAGVTAPAGAITLDAAALNAFGAESLLIGGRRTSTADGITVDVRSGNITVDNEGSPLTASDLVLVARNGLTIAEGAEIRATGTLANADTLRLSGNGALLRVAANVNATTIRTGASGAGSPLLSIGAGATLAGKGLILDSTSTLSLDPAANLLADAYTFGSGRISIALDNAGALPTNAGTVLTRSTLDDFAAASSLSFLSYSSIDIYGTGGFGNSNLGTLALSAGEIRGFNANGGTARITANNLVLQNTANASASSGTLAPGSLEFQAGSIRLGSGQLAINGYANTVLNASRGITGSGTGGFSTQGSLTAIAPVITGEAGAKRSITAGGTLNLLAASSGQVLSGGLGSTLSLSGSSVNVATDIVLPSGSLSITATSGNLTVDGRLDASGTSQRFHDVTKFTSGGEILLSSLHGDVILNDGSLVDVSARPGGGDAGKLGVSVPEGSYASNGSIRASGGTGGKNGSFSLEASELGSTAALSASLASASLTESQSIRVRNGDVVIDGIHRANDFTLSADRGDITVTGTIDASGRTGGAIHLAANGDLTTVSGSRLTVAGQVFSNSGKGGKITLEAGAQRDGVVGDGSLSIQAGSILNLSVASKVAGDALTPGSSAYQGQFSGQLHLRASVLGNDIRVSALDGTIRDASSVIVEGYRLYDLTSSGGNITTAVQNQIRSDAAAFFGVNGTASANSAAITQRLLANNPGLESILVLAPGAEIINRTGNLTLGSSTSNQSADWDLSGFRFGAKGAAGVLTMRAAGDLVLFNALSDGFTPTLANSDPSWLWTARLANYNAALPANAQSWSYRLTAGADLSGADFADTIRTSTGSLKLGKTGTNIASSTGITATTLSAITNRFQTIRTGSGDIEINAAANVQFLNQFATIYTAGTRVSDPTMGGTFRLPSLSLTGLPSSLGNAQQTYAALYSMAGGDVRIHAGNNIERLTLTNGNLVADSQFQMPSNWLYRRGYVDPATGTFGINRHGESASTTWWIDFSNFFQGVGALGGGDVTMTAGNNISNVDAVVPTNARMPGYTDSTQTTRVRPDSSKLLELGGGDLLVQAGNDIDAGVYYVERGHGSLDAGGSIHTNATRSVLAQSNINVGQGTTYTQLPTTLFLGKGGFDISARGDVLLGPVSNPFLLPGGLLNSFWHKSYFSTYAQDSYVNVSSLGGDVTLRNAATMPGQTEAEAVPLLQSWYSNKLLYAPTLSASDAKPWLRLNETAIAPFETMFTLRPGSLEATSFSGDIALVGSFNLSPAAKGSLELLASGSINALQPNGVVNLKGVTTTMWGRSLINLSDADPAAIPGIATPFAYQVLAGTSNSAASTGGLLFLDFVNRLFAESGGTIGQNTVLQTKQALHAAGLLHRDDEEPTRIYAGSGDISGLTLFSPKETRVIAGRDIADIALYIQNLRASDASIVASGRDLSPYDSSSLLRVASQQRANAINDDSAPQAGDIQISGPGSLQVLAGRDLDLGTGPNNPDGTGTGINSIGNTRNPYLPFDGADLVVGAGIGASAGLSASNLNIPEFIDAYVLTPEGEKYLKEIAPGIVFADQPEEEQARLALEVFFRLLRDAGRNYAINGNYDSALDAIKVLFGTEPVWDGDILTRARDIRTTNGGDIAILAPGGGLQLASTILGNPLSPPGIITESGGNISIFANNDINIGIGRIFTLRGGNEIIWSTKGDIAAGSSSKTVQAAPPTRVLIDPQSAAVETDLSGLATGGGIGVLATVKGVPPGNVDLIAPEGTVDAGDAGIRVSGNLNIAANQVLNAGNIAVTGSSAGTPAAPSAPSVTTVTTTANTVSSTAEDAASNTAATKEEEAEPELIQPDSEISVELIGYGGGEDEDEEDDEEEAEEEISQ
ncbi:filamentous hemagglutinin family protein [Luteolibacter sp. GHJ8]|uniref:Filamentous hemagglutinin family protein n=1 Tax=Luteolibacter rhizosphaerae TaxID=2989719 RepID=A0ABT3FWG1_9BACT|nr:filamentous haemagglutinin family protein [Luteolibacter rhizosphaerae]MCW1911936.1 filamentous hemagglutinin family protein [Luteolibacter rhizosphaerae]